MHLAWNTHDVSARARVIRTIDVHAAGEPLRIVTDGLAELPGNTMLERRQYMQENLDDIRRVLMHEPRGHRDMYGCIVTPPVTDSADIGVLFMHNAGYSTMCGHGIIALVTALIETGAIRARGGQTPVDIDTPAGLVRATGFTNETGHVDKVSFLNVPSFLYRRDLRIDVPTVGSITLDVAFGGAFYAILSASEIGLPLDFRNLPKLVAAAEAIKQAVVGAIDIQHPAEADLGFLYGVILTGPPEAPNHHSRNLCVFADAEVDRSPTGTGVSARLAVHHAKGEIEIDEHLVIESILGRSSTFDSRVVAHTMVGETNAIVPEVTGQAFITGRHEFVIHPDDAMGQGFFL